MREASSPSSARRVTRTSSSFTALVPFGHFSAKKYGVTDGGILEGTGAAASERLRKGVAETRASVGKLNSIVTSASSPPAFPT